MILKYNLLENLNSIDFIAICFIVLIKIAEAVIDLKFNKLNITETKTSIKLRLTDSLFYWLNWLFNLAIFTVYFLLIKFFIHPNSASYAIFLVIMLLIVVAKPVIIFIVDRLYKQEVNLKKWITFTIINQIYRVFHGFMVFSILLFGLIENVHLSKAYNAERLINSEIQNINRQNNEITTNINTLTANLDNIQETINKTKNNANELKSSLKLLEEKRRELTLQKKEIESVILDLEAKREDEIKNDKMYQLIAKLFQQNTFTGIIIGVLTSLLASFLFRLLTKKNNQ